MVIIGVFTINCMSVQWSQKPVKIFCKLLTTFKQNFNKIILTLIINRNLKPDSKPKVIGF